MIPHPPKEIVLDLAEMTRAEQPAIEEELLDFGVVGPGPRRTLNFVFNRRWLSFPWKLCFRFLSVSCGYGFAISDAHVRNIS